MANEVLTAQVITESATLILDNELMMGAKVWRDLDKDFGKGNNGYTTGDTVKIARPTDFTIREGRVASTQDVVEGSVTLTVDTQVGIDTEFTSAELALDIRDFSTRIIKPAMIQIANHIDAALLELALDVPQYAGTPGQVVNSFNDFTAATVILNEYGVPMEDRSAMLTPTDKRGIGIGATSLFTDSIAKPAYRKGDIGMLDGVDTYMCQNIATYTAGAFAGTVLIDGSITTSTITYDAVKDTNVQTIHIDGLTGATAALKKGDVFTIAGVFAVNPVTKASLGFLKQFTLTADATASSNEVDLIIHPAMIWTGANKTVEVVGVSDLNNQGVTFLGAALGAYRQNILFHKNAFALATVPLKKPDGIPMEKQGLSTEGGISVRLVPYYDGTNDISKWRFDVLYGIKTIDPRLAVRLSGTA